jgi:hypothetical protein
MAQVRSDVVLAIARALGDAGIELPVSTTELVNRRDLAEAAE